MPTTTHSLAEQLSGFQAEFQQQVPQDIQNTMATATDTLESSGIVGQALSVGATAPDFALPDATGNLVTLSTLLKQGPVVINFYRGEWCPYCNLELRAFQHLLPEFQQAGATLVAISPELPDHSLSVTEKHSLEFAVLSDVGNQVSRQYGLVFTLDKSLQPIYQNFGIDIVASNGDNSYELPLPGTYVIDQTGHIRYAFVDADYTQRAEPQDVLAVVSELTA